MSNTLLELSEEEFDAQYPLLANHLNPNASWAHGDGPGCLFETYGEELSFVRQQDPRTVWTLVDGDDGDQYVLAGFHYVNRIGYLISTRPCPDNMDIQVRLPMPTCPDNDIAVDAGATIARHMPDPPSMLPVEPVPAAPSTPLLVPKGQLLIPRKMYLRLYHGRLDPAQEMDDWGFAGPTFGPLSCYVHTYCCTFRIHGDDTVAEVWLEKYDDMIFWDGCYYGDMEQFIAQAGDTA